MSSDSDPVSRPGGDALIAKAMGDQRGESRDNISTYSSIGFTAEEARDVRIVAAVLNVSISGLVRSMLVTNPLFQYIRKSSVGSNPLVPLVDATPGDGR